jgi:hypothetical protein
MDQEYYIALVWLEFEHTHLQPHHIDAALEEMLFSGGSLNATLLVPAGYGRPVEAGRSRTDERLTERQFPWWLVRTTERFPLPPPSRAHSSLPPSWKPSALPS